MLTGACSTLRPIFSKLHHVASSPKPDVVVRRLRSPPERGPVVGFCAQRAGNMV